MNSPVSENFGDTLDGYVTVPEYEVCKHAVQCVIRQPYLPPSPSLPFIVHEVSKYHEHMMNKTQDDLTGCLKCFSVEMKIMDATSVRGLSGGLSGTV